MKVDYWLIRIGLGFIWVGIFAAALTLFFATRRSMRLFTGVPGLRFFLGMEILALLLLFAQIPLFSLGFFFIDGLITALSALLFTISGYGVTTALLKVEGSNFRAHEK